MDGVFFLQMMTYSGDGNLGEDFSWNFGRVVDFF